MKINFTLDTSSRSFQTFFTFSLFAFAILLLGTAAYSWTAPTGTAPNSNVEAPVNTGSTSQTKSGPLGVGGFLNTGSTQLNGNVGVGTAPDGTWKLTAQNGTYGIYATATAGQAIRGYATTGYAGYFVTGGTGGGVYSQNGSGYYTYLDYPNSSWGVYTNGNTYAGGYVRGDGGFCIGGSCITSWSQVGGGGVSAVATVYCSTSGYGGCTATCPSGYYRTGCYVVPGSPYYNSVYPTGSNACATGAGNNDYSAQIHTYCAK